MPKVDDRKEAELKRAIRAELGLNPLVSSRKLQAKLEEKFNQSIDRDYILKLVKKINIEVQLEGESIEIRSRVNQIRERMASMIERLLKIAFWRWDYLADGIAMPTNVDIIMAVQTIMKMDIALLEAEKTSGLFKRKAGAEDEWRRLPVDPAFAEQMMKTMAAWHVLPSASDESTSNTISPTEPAA